MAFQPTKKVSFTDRSQGIDGLFTTTTAATQDDLGIGSRYGMVGHYDWSQPVVRSTHGSNHTGAMQWTRIIGTWKQHFHKDERIQIVSLDRNDIYMNLMHCMRGIGFDLQRRSNSALRRLPVYCRNNHKHVFFVWTYTRMDVGSGPN